MQPASPTQNPQSETDDRDKANTASAPEAARPEPVVVGYLAPHSWEALSAGRRVILSPTCEPRAVALVKSGDQHEHIDCAAAVRREAAHHIDQLYQSALSRSDGMYCVYAEGMRFALGKDWNLRRGEAVRQSVADAQPAGTAGTSAEPGAPSREELLEALRQVTECLTAALTGGQVSAAKAGTALVRAGQLLEAAGAEPKTPARDEYEAFAEHFGVPSALRFDGKMHMLRLEDLPEGTTARLLLQQKARALDERWTGWKARAQQESPATGENG